MTTPPMTLEETKDEMLHRIKALRKKADAHLSISDLNYRQGVNGYAAAQRLEAVKAQEEVGFLESAIHHLEAGKRDADLTDEAMRQLDSLLNYVPYSYTIVHEQVRDVIGQLAKTLSTQPQQGVHG